MIRHTPTPAELVPPFLVVDTRDARHSVERVAHLAARGYANVLITGDLGVDTSEVARFIHDHSDRSTKGFATIECKGLSDLLFESALFGHKQGSFTGAYCDRPGLLESVAGGTIFLHDVGALSMRTQVRLLRYLETGESLRIGGNPIQIQPWLTVRLIASTTTDLQARVTAGWFLHDLYLRLSVHRLPVPPVRARRDHIPDWTGHRRQLKSVVQRRRQ